MDTVRFDALTRMISSRRVLSGVIAGTLTSLLGFSSPEDAAAAPCPKNKKRCGKKCISKHRCCTNAQCKPRNSGKVCKKGRCVCPGGMKRCGMRCVYKAAPCPPLPAASCSTGIVSTILSASFRYAQTFTEPNGGRLTAAAIWFRNEPATTSGVYQFTVQTVNQATGVPEETVLGGVLRSANLISATSPTWVRFDLPVPVQLLPGRQYALVLTLLGAGGWFTLSRTSAECPDSALFIAEPDGPFLPNDIVDLPYQTFVKP